MAEDDEMMKTYLGINAFINWPKVSVKAGETLKLVFNKKGELKKIEA